MHCDTEGREAEASGLRSFLQQSIMKTVPTPRHTLIPAALALALAACSQGGALPGPEAEMPPPSPASSSPPRPAEARSSAEEPLPAEGTLAAARRSFVTRLLHRGPAPQEYKNEQPPPGVTEVRYTSGDLQLKGWLSAPVPGKERAPAVVYLHGGFAFGLEDWRDASAFVDAGFVVFMPMLRGENGNPGVYEAFYGEVDDAVAAGSYVRSLPHVDGDNIFVVGHSVGGVLAVLTAMMPSVYKAAASFSGYLDTQRFVARSPPELVPFGLVNPEETRVRNPHEFASSLRIPLVLYADVANLSQAERFAGKARDAGKPCEIVEVPGDHATMVAPSVARAIEAFRAHMKR